MGNLGGGGQQQPPSQVPFAQAPQRPHHLQYAYVQAGNQAPGGGGVGGGVKRAPPPSSGVGGGGKSNDRSTLVK